MFIHGCTKRYFITHNASDQQPVTATFVIGEDAVSAEVVPPPVNTDVKKHLRTAKHMSAPSAPPSVRGPSKHNRALPGPVSANHGAEMSCSFSIFDKKHVHNVVPFPFFQLSHYSLRAKK